MDDPKDPLFDPGIDFREPPYPVEDHTRHEIEGMTWTRLFALTVGLSLTFAMGYFSWGSYTAQAALDEATLILNQVDPASADLSRANDLLAKAEKGFAPKADIYFARGDLLSAQFDQQKKVIDEDSEVAPWRDSDVPHSITASIDFYQRGLTANPFSGLHHLYLANLHSRTGRDESALFESRSAVRAAPYHKDLLFTLAENHFYQWLEYGSKEDLAEGTLLLARINAIDPTLIPETMPWLEIGDHPDVETFSQIVPDTVAGHAAFASYLTSTGRFEAGVTELEKAHELDPTRVDLPLKGFLNLAVTLEECEQYERALQAIEKARGFETEKIFRGERERSRILFRLGRIEEAWPALLTALRLSRQRDEILFETFQALRSSDSLRSALTLFPRLEEEFPFYEKPNYYLALAHKELGDTDTAATILVQYVRKNTDIKALETLSKLMMEKRQWRIALQYLERARVYSPNDDGFAALERQIREKIAAESKQN